MKTSPDEAKSCLQGKRYDAANLVERTPQAGRQNDNLPG